MTDIVLRLPVELFHACRVYKLLELNKRNKTRKRLPKRVKKPLIQPKKTNQVRILADEWVNKFNHFCPHESLEKIAPVQFRLKNEKAKPRGVNSPFKRTTIG